MTRRRRPILIVLTRPALMSAYIVVLPTPTSLKAVFTGTANGFALSGASGECVPHGLSFAHISNRLGELRRFPSEDGGLNPKN